MSTGDITPFDAAHSTSRSWRRPAALMRPIHIGDRGAPVALMQRIDIG
jgi:hypothetical protein